MTLFLAGTVFGAFSVLSLITVAVVASGVLKGVAKAKAAPRATKRMTKPAAKSPASPPARLSLTDTQVIGALKHLCFTKAEVDYAMANIPSKGNVGERIRAALLILDAAKREAVSQ